MTDAWDGLPPDSERSDHHWLLHPNGRHLFVDRWMRSPQEWFNSGPPEAASVCTYLGPCLLPAEVEARVAAARRERIEEIEQLRAKLEAVEMELASVTAQITGLEYRGG